MVDKTLAGACGLYCGACAIYRMDQDRDIERLERAAREVFDCQPEEIACEGCRGPTDRHWTPDCRIVACTRGRGIAFCSQCTDFPCAELAAFSAERRHLPLTNLRRLDEVGPHAWLVEQAARWRCPACSRPVDMYSQTCHACGAELPL